MECGCLCSSARHHDVCAMVAEDGLRQPSGYAISGGGFVCRPCFEATRDAIMSGQLRGYPGRVDRGR